MFLCRPVNSDSYQPPCRRLWFGLNTNEMTVSPHVIRGMSGYRLRVVFVHGGGFHGISEDDGGARTAKLCAGYFWCGVGLGNQMIAALGHAGGVGSPSRQAQACSQQTKEEERTQ